MSEFAAAWDSFYVIVGAAAGALIGLQFVVITLIAEKPPKDAANASATFATPTIVHFSASLLLGGLVYTGVVTWLMRKQAAYRPGFEDWVFHLALPAISYALLGAGALAARGHMTGALFAVAGSALLLLFIGIHNAWDAVVYHVFVSTGGSRREVHHNRKAEKESK